MHAGYGVGDGNVGIMVGGVEVGSGVDVGRGVLVAVRVLVGRGVLVAVGLGPGVRDGTGVFEGVAVGGNTGVGVRRASAGYSCSIAEYQSRPSINANSVKRAPEK
jgi:hypothetical protein